MWETTPASDAITPERIIGVVAERQTYKNLFYVLLAFPLGLAYFVGFTFGFVFGILLLVVGIGAGILFGMLIAARIVGRFERLLANRLLTIDVVPPDDIQTASGVIGTVTAQIEAASNWRALGFVLLKFWIGFFGILLLFLLWNALELVTAPLRYPTMVEFGTVNDDPIGWTISSLPEAVIAIPIGILLALALLHLANLFGYISERMVLAFLGDEREAGATEQADERPDDEPQAESESAAS